MAVGAGEQLAGLDHGGELGHGVVVEDGKHREPTGEVVVNRHVTETVGARAGAGASAARHRGGCSESKKLGLARESKEVVRAGQTVAIELQRWRFVRLQAECAAGSAAGGDVEERWGQ